MPAGPAGHAPAASRARILPYWARFFTTPLGKNCDSPERPFSRRKVRRLAKGRPDPAAKVVGLFEDVCRRPFRTIATILLGGDRISPCPVCGGPDTTLGVQDHVGLCYGGCGKVKLGRLYDVYLKPRMVAGS